jgi:hypothetical protein
MDGAERRKADVRARFSSARRFLRRAFFFDGCAPPAFARAVT